MFLAFFDVHNIHFAKNFQIFNFFAIGFSSMTNFIPQLLVAKKKCQKRFILISMDCQSPKYLPENTFYAV